MPVLKVDSKSFSTHVPVLIVGAPTASPDATHVQSGAIYLFSGMGTGIAASPMRIARGLLGRVDLAYARDADSFEALRQREPPARCAVRDDQGSERDRPQQQQPGL